MSITVYLYYEDVEGALKFLAKAFGFQKFGATMKGPDGKLQHAAMKLGDDLIMMGYPGPKYRNPKRLGQTTHSLYVTVDDVEKHFERAKKAGATIIEELQATSYGPRRYGAADPEGHEWYVAEEVKIKAPTKRASRASKSARKN
jgi:PhnB protein